MEIKGSSTKATQAHTKNLEWCAILNISCSYEKAETSATTDLLHGWDENLTTFKAKPFFWGELAGKESLKPAKTFMSEIPIKTQ